MEQLQPRAVDTDAVRAPLRAFAGRRPPAPDWFAHAMSIEPRTDFIEVYGTRVEVLRWGDPTAPGLLLMHGNASHASLWRPFAPMLAERHHVIAFSWPGMGHSEWRSEYSLAAFARDMVRVAEMTGLFEHAVKPIMAAHSLGGGPATLAARDHGERFGGLIVIDSGIRPPGVHPVVVPDYRPHKSYASVEDALEKFRFAPPQPAMTPYLADMVARASLRRTDEGWTWQFDPALWRRLQLSVAWDALAAPRCRLALMTGEHSAVTRLTVDRVRSHVPPGTPHIVIPDAYHQLMIDQPLAFVAAMRTLLESWR